MAVKKGDKVKVSYKGTLEDGTVFDESKEPLEFEVGSGQLIKGFDQAVIGMEKEEEKEVTIKPEDAYGQPNPELIKKVSKSVFGNAEIKQGVALQLKFQDGQQVPAMVKEVIGDDVFIDLNHPLAGKVLKFNIKILEN